MLLGRQYLTVMSVSLGRTERLAFHDGLSLKPRVCVVKRCHWITIELSLRGRDVSNVNSDVWVSVGKSTDS